MSLQFPRMFAYVTTVLMLSAFYYVLTFQFYSYVEVFNLEGIVVWVLLIATISRTNFYFAKRFHTKTLEHEYFSYLISVFFVLPIAIQITLRTESGVYEMKPLLFSVLFISSLIGAHFGIKKGKNTLIERIEKHQKGLDDIKE